MNSKFFQTKPDIQPVHILSSQTLGFLPQGFTYFRGASNVFKMHRLFTYHQQQTVSLFQKYPRLMPIHFTPKKLAYRLSYISPQTMIKQGGFKSMPDLYLSNTGSGDNTGSICFSLLPEITALFYNQLPKHKKKYIYGCLLDAHCFAPGGLWRQIIVPGALPTPKVWVAREVLSITNEKAYLGPMIGQINPYIKFDWGNSFSHFCKPFLNLPGILDYGNEDQPMLFNIIDTSDSVYFQEIVSSFYKQKINHSASYLI